MSANETQALYIAIWLITIGFAFLCQKTVVVAGESKTLFRKLPFVISFFIPWFFYAFTDIGFDYATYSHIFDLVTWDNFYSLWIEPGYALLNLLIKTFTSDSVIGIIIIKTISMILVYAAIYDYRDKAHVGFAVMGYMSLLYLDSFCMIRINLAAGLIFYALSLYQNHNRKLLALLLGVSAVTIHYSAIIFVGCFAIYFLLFRKIKKNYRFMYLCFCMLVLGMSVVAVPLMNFVLDLIPFLTKYAQKYSLIDSSGLGIMQIVFHLPFVLLALETMNVSSQTESPYAQIFSLTLVLAPLSLFFGSMGYSVQVIGRCYVLFIYVWSVGVPAYYVWRKNIKPRDSIILGVLIFVWSALRLYFYLNEHLIPAGIDRYFFLWQ